MINTAFIGAAGLRQPLLHSSKTNKLARQRAALQLLSGAGSGRSRDSFTISSEARKFSRESIVALVDKSANVSREDMHGQYQAVAGIRGRSITDISDGQHRNPFLRWEMIRVGERLNIQSVPCNKLKRLF